MQENQVKIKVEPIKEVFYSSITDYGVYACNVLENLEGTVTLNKYGNLSLVGKMPQLNLYQIYQVSCKEIYNAKYKQIQYEVVSFEYNKPTTTEEQRQYLSVLLTSTQVESIMAVYNKPVDEVLNKTFDYNKVHGFGPAYYGQLEHKVMENFVLFELIGELGKFNITYTLIKKIYDTYKDTGIALQKIKQDPYILYTDIDGVGFLKADKIADSMGIKGIDKRRVIAATYYCMEQIQNEGHTWIFIDDLYEEVFTLIDEDDLTKDYLLNCLMTEPNNRFYISEQIVALKHTYETELSIREHLLRIHQSDVILLEIDVEAFIKRQEERQGFLYDKKQKELFYNVCNFNINVLTGSAGCGKTTNINGLLNMFEELNLNVYQFAYSGKAAQVLQKITGKPASTIHRGLGWTPLGFSYNQYEPLLADVIVVDEVSMIDIFLFNNLLKAIPDSCRLILIGDPAQLESISPGNILLDMLDSNIFSSVQLMKVFRQALESGIIELATKVRNGEHFILNNSVGTFTFGDKKDAHIICGNKDRTKNNVIRSYKALLKRYSPEDIIVLLPTKKSECGTKAFNTYLQELVNAPNETKTQCEYGKEKMIFRETDLVINTSNNYKVDWYDSNLNLVSKERYVYNGEIGRIKSIKFEKFPSVFVDYSDRIILYDPHSLSSLELAYALTVHKYQGSQAPVIILGLDTRHWYQLKRSLLYTGITRAQELLVICTDPKALNRAIENNPIITKRTFLKNLLNVS